MQMQKFAGTCKMMHVKMMDKRTQIKYDVSIQYFVSMPEKLPACNNKHLFSHLNKKKKTNILVFFLLPSPPKTDQIE